MASRTAVVALLADPFGRPGPGVPSPTRQLPGICLTGFAISQLRTARLLLVHTRLSGYNGLAMEMNTAFIIALRPITAMLILAFVLAPIRRVFDRFMPEGRTWTDTPQSGRTPE